MESAPPRANLEAGSHSQAALEPSSKEADETSPVPPGAALGPGPPLSAVDGAAAAASPSTCKAIAIGSDLRRANAHASAESGTRLVREGAVIECPAPSLSAESVSESLELQTCRKTAECLPEGRLDEATCIVRAIAAGAPAGEEPEEPVAFAAPEAGNSDQIVAGLPPPTAIGAAAIEFPQASDAQRTSENSVGTTADEMHKAREDREEFTGLRIQNRCVEKATFAKEVRGNGWDVLPISRLSILWQIRRQKREHVVIGVLCDVSRTSQHANGEEYIQWTMTDLAEPEPRIVKIHVVSKALMWWRKRPSDTTRGSIFAMLNPHPFQEAGMSRTNGEVKVLDHIVRVGKPDNLLKLGDCPSLGFCDIKGCRNPCNRDRRDRFCRLHMTLAYAKTLGRDIRISVNGGLGHGVVSRLLGKRKTPIPRPIEEHVDKKQAEARAESAKRMKSLVAAEKDERSRISSSANADYFRSLRHGENNEQKSTSNVPMLGRGLKKIGEDELELDEDDEDEKKKAERIWEKRATRDSGAPAEAYGAACTLSIGGVGGGAAGTSRATQREQDPAAPTAKTRSLADLIAEKRTRRRTGAGPIVPADVTAAPAATSAAAAAVSEKMPAVASAEAPAAAARTSVPTAVPVEVQPKTVDARQGAITEQGQAFLSSLDSARSNADALEDALRVAEELPLSVFQLPIGRDIYIKVGYIVAGGMRPDLKTKMLALRRRWRQELADAVAGSAGA